MKKMNDRRPPTGLSPDSAPLRLGIPTHPQQPLSQWIRWARAHEFDFVELFIEPPACALNLLDTPRRRRELRRELDGFPCLGHLPPCLPLGSPFPELRRAVAAVTTRYARFFADIGCPAMTVHANWASSLIPLREEIAWQRETLTLAAEAARRCGVTVLFEMIPHWADSPARDAAVIAGLPGVGYMLDVGHGNLSGRRAEQFLKNPVLYAGLRHLHLHDNDGQGDRHWPIVAGRRPGGIDWRVVLRELQKRDYRGTATLEFHSGGKRAFLAARRCLQALWERV